jgi:hypothetical protein
MVSCTAACEPRSDSRTDGENESEGRRTGDVRREERELVKADCAERRGVPVNVAVQWWLSVNVTPDGSVPCATSMGSEHQMRSR